MCKLTWDPTQNLTQTGTDKQVHSNYSIIPQAFQYCSISNMTQNTDMALLMYHPSSDVNDQEIFVLRKLKLALVFRLQHCIQ